MLHVATHVFRVLCSSSPGAPRVTPPTSDVRQRSTCAGHHGKKALHPSTAFLCSIGRASLAWLFYEITIVARHAYSSCRHHVHASHRLGFLGMVTLSDIVGVGRHAYSCCKRHVHAHVLFFAACCAGSYKCLGTVLSELA